MKFYLNPPRTFKKNPTKSLSLPVGYACLVGSKIQTKIIQWYLHAIVEGVLSLFTKIVWGNG